MTNSYKARNGKKYSENKKKKKQKGDGKHHNQRWAVLSLSSIPLVMTLGNSMLIPVLPAMEKEIHISAFQTSMFITVYSIVAIILIPIAGYLSDHIGRKKVIIPSLILAGIGGLVSGLAAWKLENPYWIILVGRALQGVGAAGAAPIVMPLVGDMFKSEEEVSSSLGAIETSNTLGKVLSPILGAFLAGIIWFLPFFSFPVFCAISILLMIFLVQNPKKRTEPIPFAKFFKKVKKIFAENGKWLYTVFVVGVVLMFVLFAVQFYLSDTLEKHYHIKDVKKGLFLSIPLGALCLASYITGKVIKESKTLMKWLTFAGIILLVASTIALSFSNALWFMISMFAIGGIGIGIGLPCLDALITEDIEMEERGTISSIYSSMRFIGVAAGPPAMAIMQKHIPTLLFYILAAVSAVSLLFIFFGIKPDKKNA